MKHKDRLLKPFVKKAKLDSQCVSVLWMECLFGMRNPTESVCKAAKCGPMKFMCGRKKKFGVNLQGVCDVEGRFLDISIGHPGSTSDHLAFSTSRLFYKLEQKEFLAEGLCLLGDLAYVNTGYMATPYKSVRSGSKDNYDFFHSQLRIRIECAFGMLVSRWGLLQHPLSTSMSMNRSLLLVMTLCRRHNFCINERLKNKERSPISCTGFKIDIPLAVDSVDLANRGDVPLERRNSRDLPAALCHLSEQLLHGGEHHDDTERVNRRALECRAVRATKDGVLPREFLHGIIKENGYQQPEPNKWRLRKQAHCT